MCWGPRVGPPRHQENINSQWASVLFFCCCLIPLCDFVMCGAQLEKTLHKKKAESRGNETGEILTNTKEISLTFYASEELERHAWETRGRQSGRHKGEIRRRKTVLIPICYTKWSCCLGYVNMTLGIKAISRYQLFTSSSDGGRVNSSYGTVCIVTWQSLIPLYI